MTNPGFFPGYFDDQWNPCRFLFQTNLHPKTMLSKMEPMIGGKYNDRIILQSFLFESFQYLPHLRIHKSHRSIITGYGFFLLLFRHLGVQAGDIINPRSWYIIPII